MGNIGLVMKLMGNIRKKFSHDGLMKAKTDLIDYACGQIGIRSFADLGGVWGVDGGYTFYALENYPIERCYLVDTDMTRKTEDKKKHHAQLTLIKGDFGSRDVVQRVPGVDAVILFDVLLHQVDPDWKDILRRYSALTKSFIIYNPQYIGPETVRLLDLGEEEYFKNVPHDRNEEPYATVFKKMDEIHPQHGKKYRDIHNIWQWGIADNDLSGLMAELGYERIYYKNYGKWGSLENFEGHAFIFKSVEETAK